MKVDVVFPANDFYIERYRPTLRYCVHETPELYKAVTLKYINEHAPIFKWLENVLEGKGEADRIVFKDTDPVKGFVIIPDLKWDTSGADGGISNLYMSAICNRSDIKSLRDLTTQHLPLLENILHNGRGVVEDKFGIPASQIKMYVHYLPTYFHLHVHINNIQVMREGTMAGQAHLLTDIIDNIRLMPDYYQKRTVTYYVRPNRVIYRLYQEVGLFSR